MAKEKIVRTEGRHFIDRDGEEIILKGVNMVCKDRKCNHIGNYSEEDFRFLKELGVNVVRLGIFWESVEPQPGKYDDDYLGKIENIVTMAKNKGICVFLDMHQDLFSSIYEDGSPEWATISEGAEHIRTELWSESYLLSPAVQKAFDNFWNNTLVSDRMGLMDHFIKAWEHVAEKFADEPYVIGYDFFNEPFIGSPAVQILEPISMIMDKLARGQADEGAIFDTLSAIEKITEPFDRKVLSAFYDKVVKAVRKQDPEAIAFLENGYFSNAAVPCHICPVSDKGQLLKNQAFAPHGYDIFVDTDHYDDTDTSRVDLIFSRHFEKAGDMGLPVLVGEWGCYPEASEGQLVNFRHIKEMFSDYGASDTYFEFEHLKANPKLADCMKNFQ